MGSDDLFHKKRLRNERSLQRKKSQRAPYERVLIVCGGMQTEFNYFKNLCEDLRLNPANIKIYRKEFEPKKLVDFAIQEFQEGDYDKGFCVFDRDEHPRFHQALSKTKEHKSIQSIISTPCFEYWFILHFEYTDVPFNSYSMVEKRLKKHLPRYVKNDSTIFEKLRNNTLTAISNAIKIKKSNAKTGTFNPSTDVHALVEYLMRLKS